MSKETKTTCTWDRNEIRTNLENLKRSGVKPEYVCSKCGKVAKKETHLCKPEKLPPAD